VLRVLLCGTNYGSSYIRSLYQNDVAQLAGVFARSERSREIAAQCGVPFYTQVDEVPRETIDSACVAIPGPTGHQIIASLLRRGIHVLAEHPVSAEDVTAHRQTAREHAAVYHVNAHYSDIEGAATFISAFRAARERSKLLFISVMTNPRALYSAIEIIARAAGALRPFTIEHMPWDAASFFHLARAITPSAPLTLQLQRISSEVDDGSSAWVGHNLTAGFDDGVLALSESFGPVGWTPAPPSVPQLQSPQSAEYWSRPIWRLLASPPPTFGDYASWSRDRANRVAISRLATEIATGITPPEQSDEHLLGVSDLWAAMLGRQPRSDQHVDTKIPVWQNADSVRPIKRMNYLDPSGARPSRDLQEAPLFSASSFDLTDLSAAVGEVEAASAQKLLPIEGDPVDQNDVPCCVAIALTTAMQFVGPTIPLSPLFNYFLSRRDTTVIDDVDIFDAFRSASADGVCARSLHARAFNTASALTAPTAAAVAEAAGHRLNVTPIPSFGGVSVDTGEWKATISRSLPVLFAFFMSPEYDAIRNGTTVEHRSPTARGFGHAVLAIGYDDVAQHFLVRDSRGTGIGISGTWNLPYARLGEGFIFESWVVTAVP
jgi:thiazolinyl imide reductase